MVVLEDLLAGGSIDAQVRIGPDRSVLSCVC